MPAAERRRQFLEVVKLELEGLGIHDINTIQATMLFNSRRRIDDKFVRRERCGGPHRTEINNNRVALHGEFAPDRRVVRWREGHDYPSPCIRRIFGATPHLIEPAYLVLGAGAHRVRRQRG